MYFSSAFAGNLSQVVGFLMPFAVQILNRDVQKENERYVVSVIACFIIACVLNWNKIAYGTPEQALASAGIIFLESNATYTLYFAKSGMRAGLIKMIGGSADLSEPLTEVKKDISPSPVNETNQ